MADKSRNLPVSRINSLMVIYTLNTEDRSSFACSVLYDFLVFKAHPHKKHNLFFGKKLVVSAAQIKTIRLKLLSRAYYNFTFYLVPLPSFRERFSIKIWGNNIKPNGYFDIKGRGLATILIVSPDSCGIFDSVVLVDSCHGRSATPKWNQPRSFVSDRRLSGVGSSNGVEYTSTSFKKSPNNSKGSDQSQYDRNKREIYDGNSRPSHAFLGFKVLLCQVIGIFWFWISYRAVDAIRFLNPAWDSIWTIVALIQCVAIEICLAYWAAIGF